MGGREDKRCAFDSRASNLTKGVFRRHARRVVRGHRVASTYNERCTYRRDVYLSLQPLDGGDDGGQPYVA